MDREILRFFAADPDQKRLAVYLQEIESAGRSERRPDKETFAFVGLQRIETAPRTAGDARKDGKPFAAGIIDLDILSAIGCIEVISEIRKADPHVQLLLFHSTGKAASDITGKAMTAAAGASEKWLYLPELQDPAELGRIAFHLGIKWRALSKCRGGRTLFTAFLRHMPGMAFIKDNQGRYLYLNASAKRRMKSSSIKYLHKTDEELWPPEMAGSLMAGDQEILQQYCSGDLSPITKDKDMEAGTFRMVKFPLPTRTGQPFIAGICAGNPKNEKTRISLAASFLPPLDVEDGLSRVGNNIEVYTDLLTFFCEEKSTSLPRLRKLIRNRSFTEASIQAHALKGSAATVGAAALENGARHLEEVCSTGDMERSLDLLTQVEALFAELQSTVKSYTEEMAASLSPTAPDAYAPFPGYKILLVDDNKTNIDVLIHALRDEYRLGVARDGRRAIEYVRRNRPDLILMDLRMPEMDGDAVCRILKENPGTADIPVVFLTAADNPADRSRCTSAGGTDYITKPIDADRVRARVAEILKRLVH